MALSFGNNQKASLEAYQVQLQKNKDLFTAYDAITKEYCDFKVLQAKNEVLGGASTAYDTLKEIEVYLGSNDSLSSALLSTIQATTASLAVEKARAESAEALLSTRITDEAMTRENQDLLINLSVSALQTQVDTVSNSVSDEKKQRETADNVLRTDLNTEISNRNSSFNVLDEKINANMNDTWSIEGRLQLEDISLNNKITTEKARAESVEAVLNGLVSGLDSAKFDKTGGAISGSVSLNLSESTNTYLNLSPVWRVVCSNSGDRVQFEFYNGTAWTIALPFIMGSA